MRAGEKERLGTIRMITAAIKQREVDERIVLDDAQVLVGHREDDQAAQGIHRAVPGRRPRRTSSDKESAEIALLQGYMPAQLTEAEIDALIAEAIAATGAAPIKDMGKVMGIIKAQGAGPRRHGRGRRQDQSQARRLIA